MRLNNQETAPSFTLTDLNHQDFDLNHQRDKPLLLAFFRYASCPLCNLRVYELIQNYESLSQTLDIVAVFQSDQEKIKQYVGTQNVPFRILPDPEKKLYRLYGVENSWLGFGKAWLNLARVFNAVFRHKFYPGSMEGEIHRIPADFLIDTNNVIINAYYGKDIGDHLALTEIRKALNQNETLGNHTN